MIKAGNETVPGFVLYFSAEKEITGSSVELPVIWSECRDSLLFRHRRNIKSGSVKPSPATLICVAFHGSNLPAEKEITGSPVELPVIWSECRDSNSRPLEPHSSAIPNFATPGFFSCASALEYISTPCRKKQVLFYKKLKNFFNGNDDGFMGTVFLIIY